ncbi:MAG: SurA N-terminal domain-containing protein [Chitinophagaceae bacterium]|nr:SurA N-terminal domain-containing protein [Chitinophagaceae bacterium]
MSIIQDIRDKYARLTVILIALALIGFILTDYFQSQGRSGGGGGSKSIGSVNGQGINYDDYMNSVEAAKQNMRAQGYPAEAADMQAYDQAWNQEIGKLLLQEELDNLGITVGKKEMGDILYGPNAPDDLKRQFIDSATGQYDGAKAKLAIDNMLKSKQTPAEQKAQFNNYFASLRQQRLQDKYISLLANTSNQPRWIVEKQNAEASQMAKVSYVTETYASISDSSVKVEDKMIADYISKHKDMFKQQESRSISYVSFSAAPSKSDSADVVNKLAMIKAEFDTTKDVKMFLLKQGVSNYYDGYVSGKIIQIGAKDSIFRIPVGSVYGPYLDGGSFSLARLEGVRTVADTAKVRHILININGTRDSATARTLADSIRSAIAGGANFDTLCMKYSEDPGKFDQNTQQFNGGVYDNFTTGRMVGPFNDYCFTNPVGSKGLVKTEFGYHYIEIMSQKGSGPGYKIAYVSKEIVASKETDKKAQENAMKFASEAKDIKSFDAIYEKEWKPKGFNKAVATDIAPASFSAGTAGYSRSLVRAIYNAKVGEVLQPELVNNNWVVAVVTEAQAEGTMSVAKARMYVEGMLKNKKKAEMLKQKIGKVTKLEDAAAKLGGKTITTADSVKIGGTVLTFEPKVIGAALNPANKGKVVPEVLEGTGGVYVLRVDSVGTTSVTAGDIASQRKAKELQQRQFIQSQNNPLGVLRAAATIKDKRSKRI